MNTSLTFLNSSWFWPALVGWLILMLVFFWKEWKTSGRHRLILKMLIAAIALTSLLLVILEPAFEKPAKGKVIILITEHFDQDQMDSLQKKYKRATLIDYRQGKDLLHLKQANQVFVLGSGLSDYDLHLLNNLPASYLPGQAIPGIVRLKYSKQNLSGEVLNIRGELSKPKSTRQLVLEDASGNALDSVVITPGEDQRFSLSASLKVPGDFVYALLEKDSTNNVIRTNPLPLSVGVSKTLNILIISYQPTFEIKYLKNFLAEQEHAVAVKTRITRNKFKYEFFNRSKTNLSSFDSAMLEDFDLLIMDNASWKSTSRTQRAILSQSIENEGLGLLRLGNSNRSTLNDEFNGINYSTDRSTEVILDQLHEVTFSKELLKLKSSFGLQDIHRSESDLISAYYRKGKGRIGTTVLTQTWQLKLEGKEKAYQQVWSELVEQISKRNPRTMSWTALQQFAFKDEPFKIELETSIKDPKVWTEEKYQVPLRQDLYDPERWDARIYPKTSGWHEMKAEQDTLSSFKYYVHKNQDWKSITAYQNKRSNSRFFSKHHVENNQKRYLAAIHPIWFFIVFLLAIGGLRFEPKL